MGRHISASPRVRHMLRRRKRRARKLDRRVADIDKRIDKLVGRLRKNPAERDQVLDRLRRSLDR
jgi:hypothetical protein